jgi:hypothetical protein
MKLTGWKVALSVSDAPDRARLGYPEREVERALLSVCTAIIREGGEILYAGDLQPEHFTFKIFRHLAGAYAGSRESAPFLYIIAEPIARRTRFCDLVAALKLARSVARVRLSSAGKLTSVRPSGDHLIVGAVGEIRQTICNEAEWDDWLNSQVGQSDAEAYTAVRQAIAAEADARVAMGGKMGVVGLPDDRFEGRMPGVIEEVVMTLEADKPLVLLGAYGGATRDCAIALKLMDPAARVPRGAQQSGYDDSIAHIAALRDRIPAAVKPDLQDIANDDRSEPMAFAVCDLFVRWRAALV